MKIINIIHHHYIPTAMINIIVGVIALSLSIVLISCGASRRQETPPKEELPYLNKQFELDVRWGASPKTVMLRLFDMAKLNPSDIFYDLGCGDGRVVVEAVKRYGLIGKGVDIDPARIIQSRARAEKEGVKDKTIFLNESFFDTDFSDATVIFAFLNNTLNKKLRPRFLRLLRPGTRIIMHTHDMGEWESDFSENVKSECINTGKLECFRTARLYIVPANVTGSWSWNEGNTVMLKIGQSFQKLNGELIGKESSAKIKKLKIEGEAFTMIVRFGDKADTEATYSGTVKDNTITGRLVMQSPYATIHKNWIATRDPATWRSIDR